MRPSPAKVRLRRINNAVVRAPKLMDNEPMQVRIKRLDPAVPLPEYQTDGSVAFDLQALAETTIEPNEIKRLGTGIVVETPRGYALVVAARSSTPKKFGLTIVQGIGIVDQDYSGDEDELLLQVMNITDQAVTVPAGVRLAQGMFVRVDRAEWEEVAGSMGESRGGFGSTGGHT